MFAIPSRELGGGAVVRILYSIAPDLVQSALRDTNVLHKRHTLVGRYRCKGNTLVYDSQVSELKLTLNNIRD